MNFHCGGTFDSVWFIIYVTLECPVLGWAFFTGKTLSRRWWEGGGGSLTMQWSIYISSNTLWTLCMFDRFCGRGYIVLTWNVLPLTEFPAKYILHPFYARTRCAILALTVRYLDDGIVYRGWKKPTCEVRSYICWGTTSGEETHKRVTYIVYGLCCRLLH